MITVLRSSMKNGMKRRTRTKVVLVNIQPKKRAMNRTNRRRSAAANNMGMAVVAADVHHPLAHIPVAITAVANTGQTLPGAVVVDAVPIVGFAQPTVQATPPAVDYLYRHVVPPTGEKVVMLGGNLEGGCTRKTAITNLPPSGCQRVAKRTPGFLNKFLRLHPGSVVELCHDDWSTYPEKITLKVETAPAFHMFAGELFVLCLVRIPTIGWCKLVVEATRPCLRESGEDGSFLFRWEGYNV